MTPSLPDSASNRPPPQLAHRDEPVMQRLLGLSALTCLLAAIGAKASAEEAPTTITYEQHVRPIFKAHCFRCHGGEEETKGGLDLRLRRLMAGGGDSGPAIVPGKRDQSLLYARVLSGEMPPVDHKLSPAEVALVGQWIDCGAVTTREEPEKLDPGLEITPEERSFWSFQPIPPAQAIPSFTSADRVRTPIDAFLAPALRAKGLAFSPDASKAALLTRASFDLVGLPPTREELAHFLADGDPSSYEKAIDRLLDSPHYGERWGRYWLDVAGYADSDGYTAADAVRPFAYKFRDYVVRALNADMPLDQFITEQLAGDEMVNADLRNLPPQDLDRLAATGFLRMAADGTATGGIDVEVARNQVMADTIKIVSTSLLGLSVGCAQCHDHRYDPIPQADYYRLRAVFEPAYNWKAWRVPGERLVSLWTDAERAKSAEIDAEVAKISADRQAKLTAYMAEALTKELGKFAAELQDPLRQAYGTAADKRTDEQKKLLAANPSVNDLTAGTLYQYNPAAAEDLKKIDAAIAAIAAKRPFQDFIPVLNEVAGQLPPTFLFHRGDHRQPKGEIGPGGLTVCAAPGERLQIAPKDPALPTSGRRTALARWLMGDKNPLTARVLVNRVWMNHFGRGLVNTPADFGSLGEKPSHPALLDWLARDLMTGSWKLKRLHKLIMTSTAYRQSSARDPRAAEIDPEDQLYWRMPVRRLDAETLRDRILATSGVLNRKMHGPPIPVKEDAVGQIVVGVDAPAAGADPGPAHEAFRRSLYIQVRRSQPLAMLHVFDQPVMETNCERRVVSTVATQSLMLMNSEFILQQSGYLAARIRKEAAGDPTRQVQTAWQLAFARAPEAAELETALAFLAAQTNPTPTPTPPIAAGANPATPAATAAADAPVDALASLCQILLSANEFLYVE
jgi:mono/diheme cytochrome c family protein